MLWICCLRIPSASFVLLDGLEAHPYFELLHSRRLCMEIVELFIGLLRCQLTRRDQLDHLECFVGIGHGSGYWEARGFLLEASVHVVINPLVRLRAGLLEQPWIGQE